VIDISTLPPPMTPAGCSLQDFPHTPIFRSRLFGSSFHARVTDSEWRAGVTLWLKSWDQVPAGSLPDDDIELCRLAELARDLKGWKKLKAGALRGWVLCADKRMYHPVVAEGVNNALDAKQAQRIKTANARIAMLEKRLKECSDESLKVRLTEEIRLLRQGLSLSQSQKALLSVTEPVTASKRREGEGKGREGITSTEADASGGKPPKITDPSEIIFGYGLSMLVSAGTPEKQARSFLGGLRKEHGDEVLIDRLRDCARARPLQPLEWLAAALPPKSAPGRLNAQESLEAGNKAVVARMLEKEPTHAPH
jgi:hypothetical protein